jgi:prephenate dehydrogenase
VKRVADRLLIAGVGLIGASLGLALKARGAVGEVVGLGRSTANLRVARRRGAIDRAEQDAARAGRDVDLVVVATPVGTIAPLIATLAPSLPDDAVITDVGSVKTSVVADVERALGAGARRFCGSHPIAGKEITGAAAAERDLLAGRRCIVTPTARTAPATVRRVRALWSAAGMKVEELPAARHDRLYALVSHLPETVAVTLVNAVLDAESDGRALPYAGSGFRDTTRIAKSSAVVWRDILLANREPVLAALDAFGTACARLRAAIADGDGARIAAEITRAGDARRRLDPRPAAPRRRRASL